ncbi:hypothetical protein RCL_jg27910.t1 [Rhizophagus clarus]|uniref:Uncharacterized protein n=1 Tax=Rhizophagus clarus TaxID=94130 RepID=A0A8H3QY10_9GLOM|nr:hypothetical protein RCL_jg27910.t1 [Rhizophagus clarus]
MAPGLGIRTDLSVHGFLRDGPASNIWKVQTWNICKLPDSLDEPGLGMYANKLLDALDKPELGMYASYQIL